MFSKAWHLSHLKPTLTSPTTSPTCRSAHAARARGAARAVAGPTSGLTARLPSRASPSFPPRLLHGVARPLCTRACPTELQVRSTRSSALTSRNRRRPPRGRSHRSCASRGSRHSGGSCQRTRSTAVRERRTTRVRLQRMVVAVRGRAHTSPLCGSMSPEPMPHISQCSTSSSSEPKPLYPPPNPPKLKPL